MTLMSYLTISVDDGHPTDLRVADLLSRYDLKATFYIPARNPERKVMSEVSIRELSQGFDIGGHTFNHKVLTGLTQEQAQREIEQGKCWMDDLLGRSTTAFCYPRGKFRAATAGLVKRAGYVGARTCMFNRTDITRDPFSWGVSTHARSHPPAVQLRHALLENNVKGALNFLTVHRRTRDWEMHFLYALDWVSARGGVAHLYLHGWEIDELEQWDKLARVLQDAGRRQGFIHITNSELFDLGKPARGGRNAT